LPVTEFDDLTIPVSVNAVDLETGQTEWFGAHGRMDVSIADAVYASCALPLFYPPAEVDGRFYVDGGVGSSLPIECARERGATRVIAIDVSAGKSIELRQIERMRSQLPLIERKCQRSCSVVGASVEKTQDGRPQSIRKNTSFIARPVLDCEFVRDGGSGETQCLSCKTKGIQD